VVRYSYVDADVCALEEDILIGGFAGSVDKSNILNSYIVGQVVAIIDGVLYNDLDHVSVMFGNEVSNLVAGSEVEYSVEVGADSTINNTYAIVNNIYFVIVEKLVDNKYTLYKEIGRTLEYVYKVHVLKETSSETQYKPFDIFGGRVFKFSITDGESFYKNGVLSSTFDRDAKWFVSNTLAVNINSMTVGPDTTSLPVIVKYVNNKFVLLYDMLPSNMSANIPECTNFSSKAYLDISKTRVDPSTGTTVTTAQVVLFYNETLNGVGANNEYNISVSSVSQFAEGSVINISLNSNILSTTYISINLNNRVTLTETSNGTIIRLVNNTIYTMGEGFVVLRIASTQDSSVYTDINILVVSGISDFILYNYDSEDKTPVQNTDSIYSVDSLEYIYVDDYKYYKFESENIVTSISGNKQYVANTNVGYMLEVLETNESVKISVDGTDISYRTDASNIYLFDDIDAMIISGVGFSEDDSFIYFKVTPFIIFNGVDDDFYLERIYTDTNSFITSRPAKESAYLVPDGGFWGLKNCVLVPELTHSY
ncbi:MAG: hypothetical protein J6V40_00910, partial [Clostridia bacterium]|nr:hypothetical protein [Clostridia bacterium]